MNRGALIRALRSTPPPATGDDWLHAVIVAGAMILGGFSLREFIAPDYVHEQQDAFRALGAQGLSGYFDFLPGYPGAMMVELIAGWPAVALGADDALTWRIVSVFGIGVLVAALMAAVPLVRACGASSTSARVALLLAVASPAAYWALRIGHPEEVLSSGLLVAAVIAGARGHAVAAGVLLGLASGKAWAAVAALPVLGLLLPDPRRVAVALAAAGVTGLAIMLPAAIWAPASVDMLAQTGTAAIFNTGHVFWWFGTPIDMATLQTQTVPQPRIGPAWAGELSHPLILGVGVAIGLTWCASVNKRLLAVSAPVAMRRTREQSARIAGAALLTIAGILVLRCVLDTWNVPYYILPALVCGALGEVLLGRLPVITLVATGVMWRWHTPGDVTIRSAPDVYTAFYLGWAVPVAVAYLHGGFRAAARLTGGHEAAAART